MNKAVPFSAILLVNNRAAQITKLVYANLSSLEFGSGSVNLCNIVVVSNATQVAYVECPVHTPPTYYLHPHTAPDAHSSSHVVRVNRFSIERHRISVLLGAKRLTC